MPDTESRSTVRATPRRTLLVDPQLCEGHALCIDIAPEVFDIDDSDTASCRPHPDPELWDRVQAAIDACPRGAISVIAESPE